MIPTGEWSCLISFARASLSCSEQAGNIANNSKWKYMSKAGFVPISCYPWQVNQRSRLLDHDGLTMNCCLMSSRIMENKLIKPLRDNTCQIDYGYMCIGTDCEAKSTFLFPVKFLSSTITFYIILQWLSNHNRIHIFTCTCIVTCQFLFINQDTVRL